MRALSIRQPYAELILRGTKTIEYRSRPTHIIGERFYIYASKRKWSGPPTSSDQAKKIWSDDLAIPGTITGGAPVPPWMMELARRLISNELPTGVIVGSAVIERVTPSTREGLFEWHLCEVERARELRKPERQPQPSWFRPF